MSNEPAPGQIRRVIITNGNRGREITVRIIERSFLRSDEWFCIDMGTKKSIYVREESMREEEACPEDE